MRDIEEGTSWPYAIGVGATWFVLEGLVVWVFSRSLGWAISSALIGSVVVILLVHLRNTSPD